MLKYFFLKLFGLLEKQFNLETILEKKFKQCFINDALKCLMITQSPNKTFYERNGVLLENPSGNEVLKFVAPSNRKYWLEFSNVDVINKIANVLKCQVVQQQDRK